jgi:hypothetical protein
MHQTWMGVRHAGAPNWSGAAPFSAAPATVAGNANCYPEQILPDLGIDYQYVGGDPLGSQIFADGFDRGSSERWSATVD